MGSSAAYWLAKDAACQPQFTNKKPVHASRPNHCTRSARSARRSPRPRAAVSATWLANRRHTWRGGGNRRKPLLLLVSRAAVIADVMGAVLRIGFLAVNELLKYVSPLTALAALFTCAFP